MVGLHCLPRLCLCICRLLFLAVCRLLIDGENTGHVLRHTGFRSCSTPAVHLYGLWVHFQELWRTGSNCPHGMWDLPRIRTGHHARWRQILSTATTSEVPIIYSKWLCDTDKGIVCNFTLYQLHF